MLTRFILAKKMLGPCWKSINELGRAVLIPRCNADLPPGTSSPLCHRSTCVLGAFLPIVRTGGALRASVPFAGPLAQWCIRGRATPAELPVWPGGCLTEPRTQLSLQNFMSLQPFFSAFSSAFVLREGGRYETALCALWSLQYKELFPIG